MPTGWAFYPARRDPQGKELYGILVAGIREEEDVRMATRENRGGIFGISVGGIIVIVGIVLMFIWSFWIGLIIALVGLLAFGGFARGKWY